MYIFNLKPNISAYNVYVEKALLTHIKNLTYAFKTALSSFSWDFYLPQFNIQS